MDEPKSRPRLDLQLAAVLATALSLRLFVALKLPNIEWADEIFNSLEPAHRLAFGYGTVVWEWREGIRSWVLPAFLAGVMRATAWMGAGSHGYIAGIIVTLSLLSLTMVWFGYAWASRASGRAAALIAGGACAFWYELVFFAPKAFSEVLATDVLLPGLYLGMYGESIPEKRRLFLSGLSIGTAIAVRMQLAPVALLAFLYFCHAKWRIRGIPMLAGLLLPVAAFGLADAFTWSYPFHSYIRYVWIVIFEKRDLRYGISPWYFYLVVLLSHFGPVLLLAVAGLRRSPFLGWVVLTIVASHSFIAHKEVRFIVPAMPLILALGALGFVEACELLRNRGSSYLVSSTAVTAWGLLFFALCSVSGGFFYHHWRNDAGGLIALDRLSSEPGICGLGLYKVDPERTGGYSHLHRNVPIVPVDKRAQLEAQMPGFNALLAQGPLLGSSGGFKLEGHWRDIYLYERSGGCVTPPGQITVSEWLRRSDR